jgi:DNA-binding response OmpR family regulator
MTPRRNRLLVVEDDADFAGSLVDLLEPQGFSVRTAPHGRGALEGLASFDADIALVDIRLGAENGVEVVRTLRERRPGLICILMTAYATVESATDALRSGAHDYLLKPIAPERLTTMLTEAIDRRDEQRRREREQRLAVLGNLSASIANQVNTELQAMLWQVEAIEAVLGAPPGELTVAATAVRSLAQSLGRIAETCRRILTFARGAHAAEDTDATSTLRDFEPALRNLLRPEVALSVTLPDAEARVGLDTAQLQQLLVNLVLNAGQAIASSGTVRVALGVRMPTVVLSVSDDGVGIPEPVLQRIFEPYFSTKAASEGTGLGLSVVYGMVVAAGGKVRVESQEGVGTRVELELPFAAPRVAPPGVPAGVRVPGLPLLILLVDDVAPLLGTMTRILERAKYATLTAKSAEEALDVIAASSRPPDCLVADVNLPGASGVSLAHTLRKALPGLPVLLISGDVGKDPEIDRLGAGVLVLTKPFRNDDLRQAIARLCKGKVAPT